MNAKSPTCNKCHKSGLSWVLSKKGHWYLSEPRIINTNTHGNHIEIPFVHKCADTTKEDASLRAMLWDSYIALSYRVSIGEELDAYELEEWNYLNPIFALPTNPTN